MGYVNIRRTYVLHRIRELQLGPWLIISWGVCTSIYILRFH